MLDVHSPLENSFLAALPTKVQHRLFPKLEFVALPFGKILHESGDKLHHIYFPTCAIVALLYTLKNGATAELAVVGNEGLIGMPLLLSGISTTNQAIVQSAGYAYRVHWQQMKEESNEYPLILSLMLRYNQTLMTQIAQSAACNRHHSIEQQLCRWLLVSLDRLPDNHLNMTQEIIANMLGVCRHAVNDAASKLEKHEIIAYCRGHMRVLNRVKLEQLSCECYIATRKETERLLPYVTGYPLDFSKQFTIEKTPTLEVCCNHFALEVSAEERRAEPTINGARRRTYSLQN